MLSKYTSKFIQLLKEEIELYSWAKSNYPPDIDLVDTIGSYFSNRNSTYLASSKNIFAKLEDGNISDFSKAIIDSSHYNDGKILFDWAASFIDVKDREKATLFLAKTVNRIILSKNVNSEYRISYSYSFNDLNIESDLNSLPLKEFFVKANDFYVKEINISDIRSFATFDENNSYYANKNNDWDIGFPNKSEYLKWLFLTKDFGDVSIQVTPNSYTQVGNNSIEDSFVRGLDLTENIVYFSSGEPRPTTDNVPDFKSNIEPLERYALKIQENSKYSVIDISIDTILNRLKSITDLNAVFSSNHKLSKKSISYKMVFDIKNQESVVVPSVDLFQSLLYLKSTGSSIISIYYDSVEKRIVIKGKSLDVEVTYTENIPIEGSRLVNKKVTKKTITVPTFSIVYEQDVNELTPFVAIEYIEFFNSSITFRDKYDLLNSKINPPLELSKEFISEYPEINSYYEQQVSVSLSNKSRSEKYSYVEKVMGEYLSSYTYISDGNRIAIPTSSWETNDYVLKVNEAYWNYNSNIEIEELLAFFISKGNNEGYRLLCLKILGVDYYLFEQVIIDSLIESNDIYVSKIDIDEQNISVDIVYEPKNSFISGNIYDKKEHILSEGNAMKYSKDAGVFFGEALGSNIYDKAVSTIEAAIDSRFTPSINPVVKNNSEVKALELNIDISCPIFFQGAKMATNSNDVPARLIKTLLNTGSSINNINMTFSHYQSKNYEFGHYELFSIWLEINQSQILGNYTYNEIKECYIYPQNQDQYIYDYVFSSFKDKDKNIVGFKTKDNSNQGTLIKNIKEASDSTLLVLKELGYISNSSEVTQSEAEEIKKKFILLFKARFWATRREGRRLFNEFLKKGIDSVSRQQIDLLWNRTYNNYSKPDLNKVPIFPSHNYKFGKRKEARVFNLMEAQKEGVRQVISRKNSGLLLHEVGFGKTTSSITAISSMLNTGDADRVLFSVPKSVYDKFQDEIIGDKNLHGLLPNINVVLLDNLTEKVLTNQNEDSKIKNFTKLELETISNFKKFNRQFSKISERLKRGRVTFPNEQLYLENSNWETFSRLIDEELTSYVSSWLKLDVLKAHMESLNDFYEKANSDFQEIYKKQQEIINNPDTTPNDAKSALKIINSSAEGISKKLNSNCKDRIKYISMSLIDDLGYYTEKTMASKTILIATHGASESMIRPSKQSVLRALMFKEGLGEPTQEIDSLEPSEWAKATGLSENKCKSALKILTKHPISLEKLNIDTMVVDEIHNFNNIVNRAGAKGWEHSGQKRYFDPETTSFTGKRSKSTRIYYSLDRVGGASKTRYFMKYDGTGRASDQSGGKLTVASMCFDIQYRNKNTNNVILLSATPFTDTPFQVLSVLGMANYELLLENGIESAWDFFNNYVDETYKYDLRHDGAYGLFIDVNGYYNDKALSNLITNISNVKITDAKIEASRPKKAIIPANKLSSESSGGDSIDATNQMGDVFEELLNVNSRVKLSENQEKFQELIRKYITDDEDQRPVKDIFPINEDRIYKVNATDLDLEVQTLVDEKIEEASEDKGEYADMVVNYLQGLYDKGRYAQHPIILDAINHISGKILKGGVDKPDDEELEAVAIDASQMTNIQKLAGKAIGVQQAQQALVISPYFVNLGNDLYTCPFLPDLEPDPATVFVEQSPKLMFVVESIKQTLEYQKGQLERGEIKKIGGQVIYFDKHNFGYGGKKYNAFDLLSEYIVRNVEGISDEKNESGEYIEIASIDGSTKIEDSIKRKSGFIDRGRTTIKNDFNSGKIKILIGSKAIKEGVDLQLNSHTIYICEAEFSPEVAMQLEGRIWRQKNPYDVVRVVYVLAMNTIDSFVYSKINKKVNMIKRMLELGVYEMNTTQFVIDTKEMLIQLESDPDKLTEIQYQDEINYLTEYIGTLSKKIERLKSVKRDYTNIADRWDIKFPVLNDVYNNLSEAREEYYKNTKIKKDIKKEKSLQKIKDYEDSGYKKAIDEWQKDEKSSYNATNYEISDEEINTRYLLEMEEDPKLNPLPKLKRPLSIDTQYSEIEQIVVRVNKALRISENIESVWRKASEDEQQAIRDKVNKSAGELNWIAFFDATGSFDLINYMRSLSTTFTDDIPAINIVETFQAEIKNNGKTLDDIDELIYILDEEYKEGAFKISDEIGFKKELREKWVKALAEREETADGSINGLIETMSNSLSLIRLRTDEEVSEMLLKA